MKINIGTAGNPANFFNSKYKKHSEEIPFWLNDIGLNAYEFQSTYGVNTKKEKANAIKENAEKTKTAISIHAPYYVVLTSDKKDVYERSIQRMIKAIQLAEWMGAGKIIFHPGYYGKKPEQSIKQLEEGMMEIIDKTKSKVKILPETGGKKSAVGSMDDLISFSKLHKRIVPCVDFAHEHARTGGGLNSVKAFNKIFEKIEKELGTKAVKELHSHFSTIYYTDRGEKSHGSAYEKAMGPDYKHLCKAIVNAGFEGTIICETAGDQDIMALKIKRELKKYE